MSPCLSLCLPLSSSRFIHPKPGWLLSSLVLVVSAFPGLCLCLSHRDHHGSMGGCVRLLSPFSCLRALVGVFALSFSLFSFVCHCLLSRRFGGCFRLFRPSSSFCLCLPAALPWWTGFWCDCLNLSPRLRRCVFHFVPP